MNSQKLFRSALSFGVVLVMIGIILHFQGNSQSVIVILTGLVFEFFAAMIYIWDKIKKK